MLPNWSDKKFVGLAYVVEGGDKNSSMIKESKKFGGIHVGSKEAQSSYEVLQCVAYLRVGTTLSIETNFALTLILRISCLKMEFIQTQLKYR